jgi:hypothetical protein
MILASLERSSKCAVSTAVTIAPSKAERSHDSSETRNLLARLKNADGCFGALTAMTCLGDCGCVCTCTCDCASLPEVIVVVVVVADSDIVDVLVLLVVDVGCSCVVVLVVLMVPPWVGCDREPEGALGEAEIPVYESSSPVVVVNDDV